MAKLPRPPDFIDTRELPDSSVMSEIGRIAIISAGIEDLLHALYWKLARLTDQVGAVITKDARATRISEDIIKIAKAAKTDPAKIADLKDIFSDFATLAMERNQFVHWIWHWVKTAKRYRLEPPSYKPSHEKRWVKIDDITKVADDLVWIEHRLAAHLLTKKELEKSVAMYGLAGAPDEPTPWLEIPSRQGPMRDSPRGKKK